MVRIYDAATWTEQTPISISGMPMHVWFTPDGCLAYVQLESGSTVVRYHLAPCLTPPVVNNGGSQGSSNGSNSVSLNSSQSVLAATGQDARGWALLAVSILGLGVGLVLKGYRRRASSMRSQRAQ